MDAEAFADWQALNKLAGPSRAHGPCSDCLPEFSVEMRAVEDSPAVPLGDAGSDSVEEGRWSPQEIDAAGSRATDGLARRLDIPRFDDARLHACGNGVVAPVAEWIGARLRAYIEDAA